MPTMPLLKVKRAAQITIPLELRKQFHIDEGDYIEARALPEGILLIPVTVVDRKTAATPNPAPDIASSPGDWATQFQSWVDSHSEIQTVLLDDSRAALYGDDER
jgi:AbrB family looped-hinge helix DNA binding protein